MFGLQGYVWGGVIMACVQLIVFIFLVRKAIKVARRQQEQVAPSRAVAAEAVPVIK